MTVITRGCDRLVGVDVNKITVPTSDVWLDYLRAADTPSVVERLCSKFERTDGCWEWQGGKTATGYARFKFERRDIYAHRLAYIVFRGAFDPALEIDHLCRNRGCVNPEHMEAVTHAVNLSRGSSPMVEHAHQTHCVHGHAFDEANTAIEHKGNLVFRRCRKCGANRARAKRHRLASALTR